VSWLPESASKLKNTNEMSKDEKTTEPKSHAPLADVSKCHNWKIIFHERTKSLIGGTRDEYRLVDADGEIRYIGTHSMCVWKLEEGVC
jgi:hypothetical protein